MYSIVYRLALTADYKESVTQHHVSLLQLLLVRPHLQGWVSLAGNTSNTSYLQLSFVNYLTRVGHNILHKQNILVEVHVHVHVHV